MALRPRNLMAPVGTAASVAVVFCSRILSGSPTSNTLWGWSWLWWVDTGGSGQDRLLWREAGSERLQGKRVNRLLLSRAPPLCFINKPGGVNAAL